MYDCNANKRSYLTMPAFDPKVFTLSAPAVSALVALLIILFDVYEEGGEQRRIKLKLALYLVATAITTSSAFIYFYYPALFLWINGLYMFAIVSMPIFLYAFIFKITRTDKPEHFSNWHFAAPTALALILIGVALFTPFEEQLMTVKGNGAYNGGSRLFFHASNGKMLIRLVFSAVYIFLIFKRLPHYRSYITNYSANETKSSLRWVPIYIFFLIGTIPIPLLGQFVPRDILVTSGLAFLQVLLLILQHGFLAFHVIKKHYILQSKTSPFDYEHLQTGSTDQKIEQQLKKNILTHELFESYIKNKRPYLNPELKITDLVDDLKINRTYISSFINSEYNMNFNTCINSLRAKEFSRLQQTQQAFGQSDNEMAEMAGFNNHRTYKRFIQSRSKQNQDITSTDEP